MKRISNFRFLLLLTLLTGAVLGLSFRAYSDTDSGNVVANHFVSNTVTVGEEQFYELTEEEPKGCGEGGANVCKISSTYTPSGNMIPVNQATPIDWRP